MWETISAISLEQKLKNTWCGWWRDKAGCHGCTKHDAAVRRTSEDDSHALCFTQLTHGQPSDSRQNNTNLSGPLGQLITVSAHWNQDKQSVKGEAGDLAQSQHQKGYKSRREEERGVEIKRRTSGFITEMWGMRLVTWHHCRDLVWLWLEASDLIQKFWLN